ncbi:hypothetical protein RRG08_020873 [Elysia crispata]|uniref:SSD domain-containing protein n=1 Tax=Elysia crispata TaxID=231223 RepID=A0AAE0XUW6_9GAST|nr:hypothetical protein RRG08_020873 [Elysia crispata]
MLHWWAKPLSVAQTSIDELHLGCGTDQHALDQEIPRALLSPFNQSESRESTEDPRCMARGILSPVCNLEFSRWPSSVTLYTYICEFQQRSNRNVPPAVRTFLSQNVRCFYTPPVIPRNPTNSARFTVTPPVIPRNLTNSARFTVTPPVIPRNPTNSARFTVTLPVIPRNPTNSARFTVTLPVIPRNPTNSARFTVTLPDIPRNPTNSARFTVTLPVIPRNPTNSARFTVTLPVIPRNPTNSARFTVTLPDIPRNPTNSARFTVTLPVIPRNPTNSAGFTVTLPVIPRNPTNFARFTVLLNVRRRQDSASSIQVEKLRHLTRRQGMSGVYRCPGLSRTPLFLKNTIRKAEKGKWCFSCSRREDEQQGAGSNRGNSAQNLSLQQYHRQQEAFGRGLYPDDGDVAMLDIADVEPSPDQDLYFDAMDDDDMLLIDDPQRDMEPGSWQPVLTIGQEWRNVQEAGVNPVNFDGTDCGQNLLDYLNGNIVTTTASNSSSNNNMCLGRVIQRCIMFLTNRIVIRGRFFVAGFYMAVLVSSCLLMTKLRPSTHPPQLFRPDTNIQQLLDLKANFSIIDTLHCDRCSGLYKVHGSQADVRAHTPPATVTAVPPIPSLIPPPPPPPPGQIADFYNTTTSPPMPFPSHHLKEGTENPSTNVMADHQLSADQREKREKSHAGSSSGLEVIGTSLYHLLGYLGNLHGNKLLSSSSENKERESGPNDEGSESIRDIPTEVSRPDKFVRPSVEDTFVPPTVKHENGGTRSVDENFDVCAEQSCDSLKDRPLLESGATVYVVMGILGLDRSEEDEGHVLDQFKGKAVFDPKFAENFDLNNLNPDWVEELCRVCHFLANQTDLVRPGSAQCLPSGMHKLHQVLSSVPACRDLPGSKSIYHYQAPAHAEGGWDRDSRLLWLAFAFESTTSEGQAYFQAYKQYEKWQAAIAHIKREILAPDSPATSIFQTSEFWTKVLMEVVAVHSAIYGLVLSMMICVFAVAVFTGHFVLLLLVVTTILAMICCVVGVFALCGWEMGAVEAVSLSILVGSSVDYLVHIVEGYILAAKQLPKHVLDSQPPAELRRARTSLAVRHIGVAVVCSALTTVIAAVPLTQTSIQPFAKFGAILLLNTSVSVVMTLTLAVALLALFGPGRYRSSPRSHLVALVVAGTITGAIVLTIYIAAACFGVRVPGPSGEPLFSSS